MRVSLVAAVAQAYYQMREYDAELLVAQQSLNLRHQSQVLTEAREQRGVASLLDVRQAQTHVTEAEQTITQLHRVLPQEETSFAFCWQKTPALWSAARLRSQRKCLSCGQACLPRCWSVVRTSVQQRINLRPQMQTSVRFARSTFPPSDLPAEPAQRALRCTIFLGGANTWFVQPALNVPIFTGGVIHARQQKARAAEKHALQVYLGTVRQAFREVSDALIARQQTQEFYAEQTAQVDHADSAAFLSRARYKGGVAGYLELLETVRTSLAPKLNLAQAGFNQMNASVQLYRALGGGWKP